MSRDFKGSLLLNPSLIITFLLLTFCAECERKTKAVICSSGSHKAVPRFHLVVSNNVVYPSNFTSSHPIPSSASAISSFQDIFWSSLQFSRGPANSFYVDFIFDWICILFSCRVKPKNQYPGSVVPLAIFIVLSRSDQGVTNIRIFEYFPIQIFVCILFVWFFWYNQIWILVRMIFW